MIIEIWSDINCPFCYIGKRNLEIALDKLDNAKDVQVIWRSFELDPQANPPKDADHFDLLAKKYGKDREWAIEANKNMARMGAEVGLEFNMDRVRPANSFNAHRLIQLGKEFNLQNEVKERLFRAYFTEGKDIADTNVLKMLGTEVGIPGDKVEALLNGQDFSKDVRKDETEAQQMGIRGVPFFVLNREFSMSGAQPAEEMLKVLKQVQQR